MPRNATHSFQDYTGVDLSFTSEDEWNNTTVVGSCFYQESDIDATRRDQIEKSIFPPGITGVVFDRCNLVNVKVPPGSTVLPTCQHFMIQIQNDLDDWVLDDNLNPVEPVNPKEFERLGISTDPANIPAMRLIERRSRTVERGQA